MLETLADLADFFLLWADLEDNGASWQFIAMAFAGGMLAALLLLLFILGVMALLRRTVFRHLSFEAWMAKMDGFNQRTEFVLHWMKVVVLAMTATLAVVFLVPRLLFGPIYLDDWQFAGPFVFVAVCLGGLGFRVYPVWLAGEYRGIRDLPSLVASDWQTARFLLAERRFPWPKGEVAEDLAGLANGDVTRIFLRRWHAALKKRAVYAGDCLAILDETCLRARRSGRSDVAPALLRQTIITLSGQSEPDGRAVARIFARFDGATYRGLSFQLIGKYGRGNHWGLKAPGKPD